MVPFGSKLTESMPNKSLLRTKLSFETLERREMLAADMAEVSGVVRIDPQGDGNVSNDVVVADKVRIHRLATDQ